MSEKRDINWTAIREEYASGASLRSLAAKHGVSKTYLIERRDKEQWSRPTARPTTTDRPDGIRILRTEQPSPANAVEVAQLGINALIIHMKLHGLDMDLADHVKAATALHKYNAIVVNALPGQEDEAQVDEDLLTIDTRNLPPDSLAKLKALALELREEQAG